MSSIIENSKFLYLNTILAWRPYTKKLDFYEVFNLDKYILPKLYMVLIMTVEPGYGGQKIRKDTFDKIRRLRTYIDENKLDVDIEVDGGVDLNNIYEVMDAGANVIVAGTKVFHGDVVKNVQAFRKAMEYEEKIR